MLEHLISLSDAASAAATTAENTGTALDKLGLGASVAVMGLAIVFLGLISLIVIMVIYPKIAKALINRSSARKGNAAAKKAEKIEKPVTVQKTAATAAPVTAAEDDALIAVITAAIAASLGTSANGVVIKSIERSGQNVPSWGARGRIEQVYNRF
jgi:sodium pump decarboxylase gamma subunit